MAVTIDITGERFGKLVAVEIVESGTGAMWLCRCDCGGYVRRTIKDLLGSRSRCTTPACPVCVVDLQRGKSWKKVVGMWSIGAEQALFEDIRDEIADVLGFRPTDPVPELPLTAWEE